MLGCDDEEPTGDANAGDGKKCGSDACIDVSVVGWGRDIGACWQKSLLLLLLLLFLIIEKILFYFSLHGTFCFFFFWFSISFVSLFYDFKTICLICNFESSTSGKKLGRHEEEKAESGSGLTVARGQQTLSALLVSVSTFSNIRPHLKQICTLFAFTSKKIYYSKLVYILVYSFCNFLCEKYSKLL